MLMFHFQAKTATSLWSPTGLAPSASTTRMRCGRSGRASRCDNGSIGGPAATSISAPTDGFTSWSWTTPTRVSIRSRRSPSPSWPTTGCTQGRWCVRIAPPFASKWQLSFDWGGAGLNGITFDVCVDENQTLNHCCFCFYCLKYPSYCMVVIHI